MTTTLATTRVLREATLDDVPRLVDLGVRFLATTVYGTWIATNPPVIQQLMDRLITRDDSTVLVSVSSDGVVDGMIGLLAFDHPMSGERFVGEMFWWSEGRGANGLKLLRAAETWARTQGAVKMQMVAPDARAARIYEARGYRSAETVWQQTL